MLRFKPVPHHHRPSPHHRALLQFRFRSGERPQNRDPTIAAHKIPKDLVNVSLDIFDIYDVDDQSSTFKVKMGYATYWYDDWYGSAGLRGYFNGSIANATDSQRENFNRQCTGMNAAAVRPPSLQY